MIINRNHPAYPHSPGHIWRERESAKRGREPDFTDGHFYHRKLIPLRRMRTKERPNWKGHDSVRAMCCGRIEGWKE